MPGAGNLHRSLIETAAGYLQLGWSVVPLWGDLRPDHAKVAAVAWSPYQRRRATDAQLDDWFGRQGYAGLGIVCGSVSQLIVLDFDAPELFRAFEQALPELALTRTVLTRRGRHLYFRLPPQLRVASRKLAGVDLLSDGHYVVAPPTVIDGHEYQLGRGGLPKMLIQSDIDRIHAFLDRYAQNRAGTPAETPRGSSGLSVAIRGEKRQNGAFSSPHESTEPQSAPTEDAFLTAQALVHFYRSLTRQCKRNVALFRTTCLARDHGWRYEAVVAVLAAVHAAEMPLGHHPVENPKARRTEAIRTIRSAFAKPPRPPRPKDSGGLFNSIREKLLQLGQTCVVRVLEGLRLAGTKAGQLITEFTMLRLLRGMVGQHSIRKTLGATTPAGAPILERISPRYPPHSNAATQVRIDRQPNAIVNETKPKKTTGRPQVYYRIPSPEALCRLLGVTPSGSDPITPDDLKTAKGTRQALQRGLFQRRPGLYLRKWLGDRLGVSERTISRYNGQIVDVHVVPTFTQTPLGWHNLNAIPALDVTPAGTCLEDASGKRWPALKGVAQRLLKQGRGVRLLVRSLNYYWCGQGDPPATGFEVQRAIAVAPPVKTREPIVTFAQHIERLVRTMKPGRTVNGPPASAYRSPQPNSPTLALDTHYAKNRNQPHYWKPLADTALEALALQAYTRINYLTDDPKDKVSLVSARKWAAIYGESRLRNALAMLETRPHVHKPAGFVATILRTSRNK